MDIEEKLYAKLKKLGIISDDTRDYNVGTSDYAKKTIQPWSVWIDWKLDPWDADIIKRIARNKPEESEITTYEKIIHICKEKIRQAKVAEESKNKVPNKISKGNLEISIGNVDISSIPDAFDISQSIRDPSKLKKVVKYNKNGKIISIYSSAVEAAKENHVSSNAIYDCCGGNTLKTRRNTIFLYEGDSIEERLQKIADHKREKPDGVGTPIDVYDLKGNFIESFDSMLAAAKKYKCCNSYIGYCCKGYKYDRKILTHAGKIFLYKGKDIKERMQEIEEFKKGKGKK